MELALSAYRLVSGAAFPFIKGRLRASHETGFAERCGKYEDSKLELIRDKRTLWLHAVSVGEVQAASPFIAEAGRSGWEGVIAMSTVTETGAGNAKALVGEMLAFHFFAPWDVPKISRSACDALKPAAYVTVETEVWPNILMELRGRSVPRVLLNARISDRTWERSRVFRGVMGEVYGLFSLILARGEEDARRLEAMGVEPKKIKVTGDCKIDAIIKRREAASGKIPEIRKKLSLADGTMCFVAGSTHEGEEEILMDAFARIRSGGALRAAMLILAPRHPERARHLAAMANSVCGPCRVSLYSDLTVGGAKPADVVLVDEIGLLYDLYGVADAAFVGGSLVPKGGQNILEPASWGIPMLHGPHMEDFAAPTSEFDASGAAFGVNDAFDITELWLKAAGGELDASPASSFLSDRSGASRRAWNQVLPLLSVTGAS
ncbi:MAG: 3-deoxy-D-manno-octulosonic acid transferase [Synergistaceae bacterium]|jgi:3-deoxy-D-manno-octulosonic-acid transferase|nr:3-deoxy-D-manno-octulosonic acid transferase [Synergistaceae bacterium]